MKRPRVSALLPVRNGEIWMPGAIDNLNRTLTSEDEIIFVDDGSSDNTVKIIKSAQLKAPLILLTNQKPGLVAALNLGISHANNQWIARFDVDDYYFNNRIDIQFENIQDDVVAIFSDFMICGESGEYLGYIPSPLTHTAIYFSLLNSERNAHPSVIYKKEAVIKAGGYLEEDFPCEDLSLWLRLAKVGKLSGIPQPILKYLLRENSITGSRYLEAKAKTLITLRRYFDFHATLEVSEVQQSMQFYRKVSHSIERRIFFIRDILHPSIRTMISFKLKRYLFAQLLILVVKPRFFTLVARHIWMRNRRRRLRFIQKDSELGKDVK